ncbi:hypothetical protein BX616_000081 [Lobosporangium transversale]|uniref:Kinase-like domain-containing protein n=1 Tax=Lobosporangium transversale TaxID=64571 RepID=A0A1Y2H1M0_9FUNG|nr:kinase-like domain-containing protein [Lobosporangium transversale]KAF9908598.1 hypothetical protein BX616_000081 [Lobosporangium transversale]ORZ28459.1 kinase-like domain-containing protein [Lobosporangium transversale]|eukprot:XP_021886144.1 kinase-like domain-containing protein [Lobosporangium transversale]
MASSSPRHVSEQKSTAWSTSFVIDPSDRYRHHSKLAPGPAPFRPPSLGESDRETDEDALVPSLPSKPASKSFWDDAFASSTPTPKPPPRLAPMPKSPPSAATARSPPPPSIITSQRTTSTPVTPILAPGDSLDMLGSKYKSRYASAHNAHIRSLSHSQQHSSNHGGNIFSVAPEMSAFPKAAGGSPSLASLSTMGTEDSFRTDSTHSHLDPVDIGSSIAVTPSSILSHASPVAVRSFSHHHNNHSHDHNHNHSHHHNHHHARHPHIQTQALPELHRHYPNQNPFLTPSSSQTNLFSNLPSPMARSSLSVGNIFRDPPNAPSALSTQSWVSTQADEDMSESSVLDTGSETLTSVAAPNSASSAISAPSSQRKIYPGLKNTVGPYKLLHSIGQGSFSEVKMAVDTRTGDHVAIKVMSKAMIQSSDRLGISVRRESDLLKSIHHPNIIGFREVVETSLQTCIVMDYASGGELFEYVADKRAKASEQDIQYIFAQIVDAVDYLHQNNIVHRDLKLENVLLEPRMDAPLRPTVKLTDFGLAKVIEADTPLLTTRCGSEDYAAPEIILGQPYDGREADIWSLGVMLYALLVGFLPFNMRPGMGRKSFLSMIAHAEFGFPGEKVSIKRASLFNLHHKRSSSTTSTASNASSSAATTPTIPTAATATAMSAVNGNDPTSSAASGTLLPAATLETLSKEAPAEEVVSTMIVPKMRGVSPVSDEAKGLVRWLLQTVGSKRPTSQELRNHPWVVAGRLLVTNSYTSNKD